ncbi:MULTISPECIES: hypothetical protein [Arthrobacter]|uniref:hypothetical protein n=1 Tax=Arthrobacter TaxID=1663 RepID=UPI001E387DEF|nr:MULTISPECIES: hypothetical protein [Arthrobacter]
MLTVKVDHVDAGARERGYQIIHPLTTELWGIRWCFVRAPDGTVVNFAEHREP